MHVRRREGVEPAHEAAQQEGAQRPREAEGPQDAFQAGIRDQPPPTFAQLHAGIDAANLQGEDAIKKKLAEIAPHLTWDFLTGQAPDQLDALLKSLETSQREFSKKYELPIIGKYVAPFLGHMLSPDAAYASGLANKVVSAKHEQDRQIDNVINKLKLSGWNGHSGLLKQQIVEHKTLYSRVPFSGLPADIEKLPWLENINLERSQLTSLPPEIGKLSSLKTLNLGETQLTRLPPEIGQLKSLEQLSLYKTPITSLPPEIRNLSSLKVLNLNDSHLINLSGEIGNLSSLKTLFLSRTPVTNLPAELGNLSSLERLDLSNAQLTSLPPEIGNLNALIYLDLYGSRLTTLPPEIGNLASLQNLYLAITPLTNLPPQIGNLNALTALHLQGTPLTALPAEIRNLRRLTLLRLHGTPISPVAENEQTLGRRELRAHFGDRVLLDEANIPLMPATTTRDEVYQNLDQQPVRINRDRFKAATLPEIPGKAIEDGEDFMQEFGKLFSNLNLDNENSPGYLSYELLSGDYASDAQGDVSSNADKVANHLLPRLTGYFHELYGMPLEPNETKGWQMYEEQKPTMKKALTYIINTLNELPDPDQRAMLFQQLVDGMLHCPTGQKEGIDTVVKALLEGQMARSTNLPAQIQDLIATKKNSAFKTAVLTKAAENSQNVHLISHYEDQLKNELGLTNVLGYSERMGTMGQDPFNKNPANVLKTYYDLVTPQRLTSWLMEKTPSQEDLLQRQKLQKLEKKRNEATRPQTQANPVLVNRLTRLKAQLEAPEIEDEERANIKSQITNLETLVGRAGPQGQQLTEEQLKALTADIQQLKAQIRASELFKPLSPQKIMEHLIDGKLVNPQADPNWWKAYFSADPTEDASAVLTQEGAGKLLQQLGYVLNAGG